MVEVILPVKYVRPVRLVQSGVPSILLPLRLTLVPELLMLPLMYLPIGAVVLWLLGQIAVYWPAKRCSRIVRMTARRPW